MAIGSLVVRDTIIDPARAKELINPEFVPDGPFLVISNDRGKVGYRYDALPALAAAEPTAFGCILCEVEGHGGLTTLVAMLWDGFATRLHKLSPVDDRTPTVADAGGAENLSGQGAV
jgi:hypothetical protein